MIGVLVVELGRWCGVGGGGLVAKVDVLRSVEREVIQIAAPGGAEGEELGDGPAGGRADRSGAGDNGGCAGRCDLANGGAGDDQSTGDTDGQEDDGGSERSDRAAQRGTEERSQVAGAVGDRPIPVAQRRCTAGQVQQTEGGHGQE